MLVDTELQKRQNFQVILAEVQGRLGDYSCLLIYFNEMFCFGVKQALKDYLGPLLHALCRRTETFRIALSINVEKHGET